MEDIYSDTEVYHPLAVVGKGTFGKVLQCWRASDGELVALKALPTGAHMRRLITNELRLTAALAQSDVDNSHIIRFIDSFRHHTEHFLVLEMLEKNLHELQKENDFSPLPVRHIRTISCQLLRALDKLKEMAIIHADIKPENVMIVDQLRFPFRVKLIDFGSASFFKDVHFVKEPYIQSRFYRSPEILLGLPFSEKVDMWSLGCVMAELYLGWPLYPGESEFEQVRYICETQGLPSPHLLNMATKTNLFFKLVKMVHGNLMWQLRPTGQGTGPYGGHTEGEDSGTPERRKYILRSLDQLYSVHGPEHDQAFGREDTAAELADRYCMTEIIKQMLTIDSRHRINPNAALQHPFITLTHLHSTKTHYYDLSFQELQKALIPNRSSEDHSDHNCNPTAEPQNPPPFYEDQHMRGFPPETEQSRRS
ncbi:homeodomain-interacting protein kinase 4-like [Colossoma macropomum]|uniref:homeodomain-interacting protein kinase 4-like n=1 Tax=Colossoma macropomum TaxID=42526 RepID=UPI001864BEFA|nr:homeodomain-interacting protein kinase 4-like [Colossoma macropomum]